jgi:hypothetical protein
MTTPYSNIHDTKSTHTLLNIEAEEGIQWQADDLEPIWRLFLDAALDEIDPDDAPGVTPPSPRGRPGASGTVRELLFAPSPPLEELLALKEFAKKQGARSDALLPREVCSALYYICIQLALKPGSPEITGLDEQAIKDGVAWVLAQDWVDADLKALLTR